jgi:ABC-2 type transport system ATP-binding protein
VTVPQLGNEYENEPDAPEPALLIRDLRKDFTAGRRRDRRRGPVRAVDGISLRAEFGHVTALLGANGAGKTTTLACAQGLERPSSGLVRLLGRDPWRAGPDLRARVGIMLQDGGLPQAIRPIPLLRHVASMYRRPADVDALVQRLGIDEFDRTSIRRLSGGQRQRVALAAALAGRPRVLFLDEPSAGLDPHSRRVVFELIQEVRAAGTCIVLTTHLMDDAERLADYVDIVEGGRNVLEGRVEELLTAGQRARTLRFTTGEQGLMLSDLLPEGLCASLQLRERQAGSYELTGPLDISHLDHLTSRWSRRGIMPSSLELQPRNLEDLFLEISERSSR